MYRVFCSATPIHTSTKLLLTRQMSTTNPTSRVFTSGAAGTASSAEQYTKGALEYSQLNPNPLQQFSSWFSDARAQKVDQPDCVSLSTAELPSGRVSARMVYMREMDGKGFVVYSNWGTSRKTQDVKSNPHAALVFHWREQERQVRVEGTCERLTSEESQTYYDTRIRGSRIGAWASEQSKVLRDREELEQRVRGVEERYEGKEEIPVPDFWGGMRIVPDVVEFWQGRQSRLHDRFRYTKDSGVEGGWRIERLSP